MADNTEKISKVEGVRRAIQELGKDAPADEIQAFMKDRFGLDITKDHLYVAKGQVLREGKPKAAKPGRKKKRGRPRKARQEKPQVTAQPAVAAVRGGNGKGNIDLEDIQTIKGLVERIGAGQLLSLIDLLGE